jgi:hypothetical protein
MIHKFVTTDGLEGATVLRKPEFRRTLESKVEVQLWR